MRNIFKVSFNVEGKIKPLQKKEYIDSLPPTSFSERITKGCISVRIEVNLK